ncbi:hypothetical protein NCCP691_20010 [Noviherbaspirillum aridicola]|uniref:SGNH hydrolase-type esterase domain-containing protein n=2 Tax=Noviherbaspirillum aridicola TaxID=2849687 RepID=A0ABQ4Q471_9BURK|nr:hypothetical protein NCCP691_20010 [Noviherbaspirillum aridicola]
MLAAPAALASMSHIVLLGDSIFDNGSYTGGGPDVISQVRGLMPGGWKASLLAVDGATTAGIPRQLERLPSGASHLVLSVGGNDALGAQHILQSRVATTGEAMMQLGRAVASFESAYRNAVAACLRPGLPLVLCTIYNGNFPDPQYRQQVTTALAVFNDVILRTAIEHRLGLIELRQICNEARDYANPIEPSSRGGEKIARAIIDVVTARTDARRRSLVIGAPP